MNNREMVPDETLNAFIDNELDQADRQELLALIEHDADVRLRVEQLSSIKNLLQSAFPQTPAKDRPDTAVQWTMPRYAVAASILVLLGVLLGVNLDGWVAPDPALSNGLPVSTSAQQTGQFNVLFHANRNDVASFLQVLNQAEALLNDARIDPENLHIEIVANGDGLNLFRMDNAVFAAEIKRLLSSHKNISFLGCSNSLRRLSENNNQPLILLPEIHMVSLGIMHVLQRQRSGWAYIQA